MHAIVFSHVVLHFLICAICSHRTISGKYRNKEPLDGAQSFETLSALFRSNCSIVNSQIVPPQPLHFLTTNFALLQASIRKMQLF